MAKLIRAARTEKQREIVKLFDGIQGRHNLWRLWTDWVTMVAISISNAVSPSQAKDREAMYMNIVSDYTPAEMDVFVKILALLSQAYEEDPDQDLLGDLFMSLDLGNASGGQFFTPYSLCKMSAKMMIGDSAISKIDEKGWVSINDPACGAGALLIAAANQFKEKGINYQQHCLFVAQDIDFVTALMCYIQLSLIGCAGYVYVGNTITDPCTSLDGRSLIPANPDKCWFTPLYFHETWHIRRLIENMRLAELAFRGDRTAQQACEIESKTPYFDSTPVPAPAQAELSNIPANIESMVVNIPTKDEEINLLADDSGQLMLF